MTRTVGRLLTVVLLGLAAPAAAVAADDATPAQTCKTEKTGIGTPTFKKTYAARSTAKAMAACRKRAVEAGGDAAKNAAKECKAERAADPEGFKARYGTHKNARNAYGRCVSSKAKAKTKARTEARVNAAKTCRKAQADDPAAFAKAWGSGKRAFGTCVSATAKEG